MASRSWGWLRWGKRWRGLEALQMSYNALKQGASGVDMGRNIFQADDPVAMVQAVRGVVHDGLSPKSAFELYKSLQKKKKKK
jgi:3-hydroxy-5-phosphonooxypentane-2,4-dione thiolase